VLPLPRVEGTVHDFRSSNLATVLRPATTAERNHSKSELGCRYGVAEEYRCPFCHIQQNYSVLVGQISESGPEGRIR
jgi:hypothetical protein